MSPKIFIFLKMAFCYSLSCISSSAFAIICLYLFSISISSSLSVTKTLPNTKCRCPSLNNCPFLFGIIQLEYPDSSKNNFNTFLLMLNDNLPHYLKQFSRRGYLKLEQFFFVLQATDKLLEHQIKYLYSN